MLARIVKVLCAPLILLWFFSVFGINILMQADYPFESYPVGAWLLVIAILTSTVAFWIYMAFARLVTFILGTKPTYAFSTIVYRIYDRKSLPEMMPGLLVLGVNLVAFIGGIFLVSLN